MNNNLGIIFLAAGKSSRYGTENKLFEKLNEIPIFIHSIKNFKGFCPDSNVIIVTPGEEQKSFKNLLNKFIPDNNFSFAIGGKERYNSVYNGLSLLKTNPKIEFAAIHDTARPLAGKDLLAQCLDSCKKYGSGVAAKKISDTVKRTDEQNKILETVDRTNLWSVETPQVFLFKEILDSYKNIIKKNVTITDDAGTMEFSGKPVYLIENPDLNMKITYQADINLLRQLFIPKTK